ncbi:hypothetical protein B0H10DRAFT_1947488 [Mycena sp. CBHHK59/15]|nr:hypothetical protein B0H10DRAFT_1947488 [Mycena sp. CBHHK59/15]
MTQTDDYPKTMPFCDALPDAETMPVNLKVRFQLIVQVVSLSSNAEAMLVQIEEVSTWMFGSAIPQVNTWTSSATCNSSLLQRSEVSQAIYQFETYFGEIWKTAGAMPVHLETMPVQLNLCSIHIVDSLDRCSTFKILKFQGIIVNWIPRREFVPGTTYASGKQAPPCVVGSGWHGTYPLSAVTPIWLSTLSSAVTGHN